jgi:hypothetical protein
VALGLFILSWLNRRDAPQSPEAAAFILSFLGGGLTVVTGWLGGELVDRLGVGVDKDANLNAPNSLSGRPAYVDGELQTRERKEYDAKTT